MQGAAVRDIYGAQGRILALSSEAVEIGWEEKRSIVPRKEVLPLDDPKLERVVEILTLDKGWLPFRAIVPLRESARPRGRKMPVLTEIRRILSEKSKMNPFKRKSKLGPGPNVEFGTRTVKKKDDWTCKCNNYSCQCTGPDGEKKAVKIDKGYKKKYNKRYKQWAKKKKKGGKKKTKKKTTRKKTTRKKKT